MYITLNHVMWSRFWIIFSPVIFNSFQHASIKCGKIFDRSTHIIIADKKKKLDGDGNIIQ